MTEEKDTSTELFDLEEIYDTEFAPLVQQLTDLAQKHQMPLFMTFVYSRDQDGDNMCTSTLPERGWRKGEALWNRLNQADEHPATLAFTVNVSKKGENCSLNTEQMC